MEVGFVDAAVAHQVLNRVGAARNGSRAMPALNLKQLGALPLNQASEELMKFDSYSRTAAMVCVMRSAKNAADWLKVFLEWGCLCDAPWPWRSEIADILRSACSQVSLAPILPPDARRIYDELPDPVPVWRGCEQGRERGLHWTPDKAVAEKFATGQRWVNSRPTLGRAQIPKRHIFAVFIDRDERERERKRSFLIRFISGTS
jgi:hypothetical protein